MSIVLLNTEQAGREDAVRGERITLGRGPGVDLAFPDPLMSRQHVSLEYREGRFRITDLGSTNGLEINGRPAKRGEVGHGDRFVLGGSSFQLVVEERDEEPDVYELPGE